MNIVRKSLTSVLALSILSLYPAVSYADSDKTFTHGKFVVKSRDDRGHGHRDRHDYHRPSRHWDHHDRDHWNVTFRYVSPPRYHYERVIFKPAPVVRYYTPPPVIIKSAPVVIEQPVHVAAPVESIPMDTFTVNVPNTRGAYTSVVIKRSGSGFVGPQGEFYETFPLVSHLKVVYGA